VESYKPTEDGEVVFNAIADELKAAEDARKALNDADRELQTTLNQLARGPTRAVGKALCGQILVAADDE
jgi:hypothetical protein